MQKKKLELFHDSCDASQLLKQGKKMIEVGDALSRMKGAKLLAEHRGVDGFNAILAALKCEKNDDVKLVMLEAMTLIAKCNGNDLGLNFACHTLEEIITNGKPKVAIASIDLLCFIGVDTAYATLKGIAEKKHGVLDRRVLDHIVKRITEICNPG